MVREENRQFHSVNKCIIAYLNNTNLLSEEQRKALADDWKKTTGSKLKMTMSKSSKTKAPKRVMSKYIYFCQDERPRIQAENPEMNINDCTRLMGRLWREFEANPDPVRMERYTKLFEADQMRYEQEKRALQNKESVAPAVPQPKKKHYNSTYLNYCAKRRETEPKISLKVLSIGWNLVKNDPDQLALYTVEQSK